MLLTLFACTLDTALTTKGQDPASGDDTSTADTDDAVDSATPPETGDATSPWLVVTPTALSWTLGGRGPLTQTVELRNEGTAALEVTRLGVDGPQAAAFTEVLVDGASLPLILEPGESADVAVTWDAATIGTGWLEVLSDDPAHRTVDVPLNAFGAAGACRTASFFTQPSIYVPNLVDLYYSLGHGGFEGPYIIGADFGGGHGGQSQIDLDGDGLREIVSEDGVSHEVTLLRCDPAADRWEESGTGTTVSFFPTAAGDVDGDEIVDLIGYDSALRGWTALGNGDGTFRESGVPSWEPALADLGYRQGMSFRVGDLDGDDLPDLAWYAFSTTYAGRARVAIYTGRGDGTFAAPTRWLWVPEIINSLDIADIDGDGSLDLVTGMDDDGDAGSAWALLDVRSGADRWREAYDAQPDFEHTSDAPGAGFTWVRDYTGDGTPDVLSIAFDGLWTTPVLRLLEGRGDGTFRHPITVLGPGETTQWLSQGG